MIRRLHEGKNMKPVITATVRSLRGLGRPSKTANARRLRARGESVGSLSIREATVDDVSDDDEGDDDEGDDDEGN